MDRHELTRNLQSVGMKIFVEQFCLFEAYAYGGIAKWKCIDRLVEEGISNGNGALIRSENARKIFEADSDKRALAMVLLSSRVDKCIKVQAETLIRDAVA